MGERCSNRILIQNLPGHTPITAGHALLIVERKFILKAHHCFGSILVFGSIVSPLPTCHHVSPMIITHCSRKPVIYPKFLSTCCIVVNSPSLREKCSIDAILHPRKLTCNLYRLLVCVELFVSFPTWAFSDSSRSFWGVYCRKSFQGGPSQVRVISEILNELKPPEKLLKSYWNP